MNIIDRCTKGELSTGITMSEKKSQSQMVTYEYEPIYITFLIWQNYSKKEYFGGRWRLEWRGQVGVVIKGQWEGLL